MLSFRGIQRRNALDVGRAYCRGTINSLPGLVQKCRVGVKAGLNTISFENYNQEDNVIFGLFF